jgi:hypothetical protein
VPKVVGSSGVASILSRYREPEPDCIDDLVTRMRLDYQVGLADRVIQSQGNQAKVTVTSQSEDPRAVALAVHLENLFYRTRKSMWDMTAYGRVCYEKQWGFARQLNVITKLQPMPFALSEMLPLVNGRYAGCLIGEGKERITLTPRYSWWLALDPTAQYPHGRSRFAQAPYKTWKDRAELLRLRKIFIEKFVLKGAIIHAPEKVTIDGQEIDVWGQMGAAYSEYQSGAALMLPDARSKGTNGADGDYIYNVDELPGDQRDSTPLINLKNDLDAEQLLAFGIPPKTVMEGSEVGSFALVTQQMLILLSMVEEIVEQQVESFNEFVIDDVVSVNFASSRPLIRADFTPLVERPDDLANRIVESWLTTPQLSPILLSGAVDIESVMGACGVPIPAEARGKVAELVKQLQASQDAIRAAQAPLISQAPRAEMAHPFLKRIA